MAEAFWGPLCADPRNCGILLTAWRDRGHGPVLGSEATEMGPAPDPQPRLWGPHSQVPRLLYRLAAHPHPSPQMVNASLCVSQCEHWGCAPPRVMGQRKPPRSRPRHGVGVTSRHEPSFVGGNTSMNVWLIGVFVRLEIGKSDQKDEVASLQLVPGGGFRGMSPGPRNGGRGLWSTRRQSDRGPRSPCSHSCAAVLSLRFHI